MARDITKKWVSSSSYYSRPLTFAYLLCQCYVKLIKCYWITTKKFCAWHMFDRMKEERIISWTRNLLKYIIFLQKGSRYVHFWAVKKKYRQVGGLFDWFLWKLICVNKYLRKWLIDCTLGSWNWKLFKKLTIFWGWWSLINLIEIEFCVNWAKS